jgi:glycosyltransferase involved in cell wall biosynthesis
MKKILILQNKLPHYRKSLYAALSRLYDVTVLHSGEPSVGPGDPFREIVVPVRKVGPFFLQSGVFTEVRRPDYDAVIAMFDIRWIFNILAMWIHAPRARFILWGTWLSGSRPADAVKLFLARRGRPVVFYDAEERARFIAAGAPSRRLYVANNTFHVPEREPCHLNPVKDCVLFVGSFDSRKRNDVLVQAFAAALDRIPPSFKLVFVGDGAEEDRIKALALELGLGERAVFRGRINSPSELVPSYRNAVASVSFGQAGLSVLQSLAFGVPFVTHRDAISGGEKSNIRNGFNGILCEDSGSLEEALARLCSDIGWARMLGKNAFEYYSENCTVEGMAAGFRAAIEGDNP